MDGGIPFEIIYGLKQEEVFTHSGFLSNFRSVALLIRLDKINSSFPLNHRNSLSRSANFEHLMITCQKKEVCYP